MSYTKIVQSGDLLEIYQYQKSPSPKRFSLYKKPLKKSLNSLKNPLQKKPTFRFKRSIQRAKYNFTRKVRASLSLGNPYMLTLTMVQNDVSLKKSYYHFTKFTLNLRKNYSNQIAWVAVPEFQKRGAVHFHALIWGLPQSVYERERDTRDLQAHWQRGWLDILKTNGSPKIASYMAKYMSKNMSDVRLSGEKSYTASRNTMRSVLCNTGTSTAIIAQEFGIDILSDEAVDNSSLQPTVERVYNTEWLGKCRYRRYEKTINRE